MSEQLSEEMESTLKHFEDLCDGRFAYPPIRRDDLLKLIRTIRDGIVSRNKLQGEIDGLREIAKEV